MYQAICVALSAPERVSTALPRQVLPVTATLTTGNALIFMVIPVLVAVAGNAQVKLLVSTQVIISLFAKAAVV